mmetsp:Transcript_64/g.254  ORF Transcript_64/g.254 Transcript_64/m.254 type:complete len:206 (+) Transcript_64:45-662(+)
MVVHLQKVATVVRCVSQAYLYIHADRRRRAARRIKVPLVKANLSVAFKRARRGDSTLPDSRFALLSLALLDHGHVGGRERAGQLPVHLLLRVDASRLELAKHAALHARVAEAGAQAVAARILLGDAELGLDLRVLGAHAEARGHGHDPEREAGAVHAAAAGGAVRGSVDDAVDRGVGHARAAHDQAAGLKVGGAVADPGGPLVGH